jgi:hypothetical protein
MLCYLTLLFLHMLTLKVYSYSKSTYPNTWEHMITHHTIYLNFENTTQLCWCWSLWQSDAPLGTPSTIPVIVGLELVVFNTCHYSASTLMSFSKYTADTMFVGAHCIGCHLWFNSCTPWFNCCIWCPWLATEDQKLNNNFEDVTSLAWTTVFRRC